ncbi:hypothetical protein TRP66_06555 [Pseudomonas sp. JDS28PS106]|uniref:hypothetical protein n=1 Tax=Pseudomonas sp. JDS28PS106 TaxID=2497235 RepID=UPI002FD721AD
MNDLVTLGIPLTLGLLISYAVRPVRLRSWLGVLLIAGSLVATFLLPLAHEDFWFVYIMAWITGIDLVLNRNRYAKARL